MILADFLVKHADDYLTMEFGEWHIRADDYYECLLMSDEPQDRALLTCLVKENA